MMHPSAEGLFLVQSKMRGWGFIHFYPILFSLPFSVRWLSMTEILLEGMLKPNSNKWHIHNLYEIQDWPVHMGILMRILVYQQYLDSEHQRS